MDFSGETIKSWRMSDVKSSGYPSCDAGYMNLYIYLKIYRTVHQKRSVLLYDNSNSETDFLNVIIILYFNIILQTM